jgi:ubiquitin-like 1-activating enzyme E1 A
LNPRVPVRIDTDKVQDKPTEYFKQFDIVIVTDMDVDSMVSPPTLPAQ